MFCSLLKKEDVLKIIHAPQSKYILEAVTKDVMSKFSNLVTSFDVQNICDDVGISRNGYHAIHQLLKDALRKQGITENLFPVPRKVKLAKKVSDADVFSRLGPYYFVEDTMVIPGLQKKGGAKKQRLGKKSGARSKSAPATNFITEEKGFDYTQFNNIFVDVRKLQQAMVAFYRLPAAGKLESVCAKYTNSTYLFVTQFPFCSAW